MSQKMIIVGGKRKTAVAKARIREGKGNIFYNGISYEKLRMLHRLILSEPIGIYKRTIGEMKHDIEVTTSGGGIEGQIQAARLAIAKALVRVSGSEELRKAIVAYDRNMLVADIRRKETRKPGDSKARARRQTSYR